MPGELALAFFGQLGGRDGEVAGEAAAEADLGARGQRLGLAEQLLGLGLRLGVEHQFAVDDGRGQRGAGDRAVADGVADGDAHGLGRGGRGVAVVFGGFFFVAFGRGLGDVGRGGGRRGGGRRGGGCRRGRGGGGFGFGRATEFERHGAHGAEEVAFVAALDHAHQRGLLGQFAQGDVVARFDLRAGPPGAAAVGDGDGRGQDSQYCFFAQDYFPIGCLKGRRGVSPTRGVPAPPPVAAPGDATGAGQCVTRWPCVSSSLYNRAPVPGAMLRPQGRDMTYGTGRQGFLAGFRGYNPGVHHLRTPPTT
ncbi:hypothetical protein D3C72_1211670 [compost metagenome]